MGFNLVRLGISWSALEPTRGQIDKDVPREDHRCCRVGDGSTTSTWCSTCTRTRGGTRARRRAGRAELARRRCGDTTAPRRGRPSPTRRHAASSSRRDISPASDRAFQNFFFDTDGMQTDTRRRVGRRSRRPSRGESTVAGFDLLNEPGFRRDGARHDVAAVGALSTSVRSRRSARGALSRSCSSSPASCGLVSASTPGRPLGFTSDTQHRLRAAPVRGVDHHGRVARNHSDRRHGAAVRPRRARCRRLRHRAVVGRVRVLGRRAKPRRSC